MNYLNDKEKYNVFAINVKNGTVSEWIEYLKKLPQDYCLSLLGMTSNMDIVTLVNNEDKTILFDESTYVGELLSEENPFADIDEIIKDI